MNGGLPPYQPQRPPEGRYTFKIIREPGKDRKHGTQGDFISVTFYFKIQSPAGDVRDYKESILPWDNRYRDILLALGGEEDDGGNVHLSDMEDIIGKKFNARIRHEKDRNDPSKTWARIADIEIPEREEDVPPPGNNGSEYVPEGEDEIPF